MNERASLNPIIDDTKHQEFAATPTVTKLSGMVRVQARVVHEGKVGSRLHEIPTFFVDLNVVGIVDPEGLDSVIWDIIAGDTATEMHWAACDSDRNVWTDGDVNFVKLWKGRRS